MIRLVAIDLDGTWLTNDVKVLPETNKALTEAIRKGVIVVPTTGRSLSIVPDEVKNLEGINYIITSSGAKIQDINTEEVIYDQTIPIEIKEKILKILDDYDLLIEAYVGGTAYMNEEIVDRIGDFLEEKAYWPLYLNDMERMSKEELRQFMLDQPLEKINFRVSIQDIERRPEVFERLRELPDLDIIDQAEGNGEITYIEANKGEALAALCNKLGIDCTEVMAIGDSNNDISMLTFAKTGVAMGQAEDHVKSIANYVTSSNEENGVAEAVEKFIIDVEKKPRKMPEELSERVILANQGI